MWNTDLRSSPHTHQSSSALLFSSLMMITMDIYYIVCFRFSRPFFTFLTSSSIISITFFVFFRLSCHTSTIEPLYFGQQGAESSLQFLFSGPCIELSTKLNYLKRKEWINFSVQASSRAVMKVLKVRKKENPVALENYLLIMINIFQIKPYQKRKQQ